MKLLTVFYFFLYFSNISKCEENSLQLVHVFFRHGSRTPELKDTYPTDPYNWDFFSPLGYGQLTNKGKELAYKLGKLLRNRYDTFLGKLYNPDIVMATSTDFDRTKMTALLVLAGLFPPTQSQIWNMEIPWMPIPYNFDKDKFDFTLRRPTKYCPIYLKELEQVLSSDEAIRSIKSHENLFKYIEKHTEKPIRKLIDAFAIYQTLNAENSMNLTLPQWTKKIYPKEIEAVAAEQCKYENYNPTLKRLNGGRMLSKVIKNMMDKSKNQLEPKGRKIYLYSGHENNVINILSALDLFVPHVPKYSSAVIFELHFVGKEKNPSVKLFYSRDVEAIPEVQKLNGCEILCPLNNFIKIVEPHIPVNYTAECDSDINLDA